MRVTEVGRLDLLSLLAQVEAIARAASDVILQIYRTDFAVLGKDDASPVTLADEMSEALIVKALRALEPSWPVVAEEATARGEQTAKNHRWWLVDPLDGTREFVSRNGEFTVNIALIEDDAPVLGVVHVPVPDILYAGIVATPARGAWAVEHGVRRSIACRGTPADAWTLACSRSHGDETATLAWLNGRALAARIAVGSSLKFGLIATGQADVYPRFGRTMEWDTAAGHAVLMAAGGTVTDMGGTPLRYGKPGFQNPHFVAWGARNDGHAQAG